MVAQDLDGVRVATAGGRQQVGGSWRHGATGVGGRPHERPDRVGVVQHAELVPLAPLEVGDGPVAVADGGQPGQRHDQGPPVGDVLLQCRGQLGQVGPGRQLELVDGEDEPRPPAHRHLHGGGQHALEDQVGCQRRRVGARDGDLGARRPGPSLAPSPAPPGTAGPRGVPAMSSRAASSRSSSWPRKLVPGRISTLTVSQPWSSAAIAAISPSRTVFPTPRVPTSTSGRGVRPSSAATSSASRTAVSASSRPASTPGDWLKPGR